MIAMSKLVIIFVPRCQQCRLTAEDLLHCGADDDEDRILDAEISDIQPHLDHISDQCSVETLKHGIGLYHEVLSKQDKCIVERLLESGAIQVLIVSKVCRLPWLAFSVLTVQQDTVWSLPISSYLVIYTLDCSFSPSGAPFLDMLCGFFTHTHSLVQFDHLAINCRPFLTETVFPSRPF